MTDLTTVRWNDGMRFDVAVEGHSIVVDAAKEFGGVEAGPKPKTLILVALAGCTGMDVVSILKKMRMSWSSFELEVSGELTSEHPKVYESIHVLYRFSGDALDRKKIDRAIELSQTSYCGVTAMLEKTATITTSVELIEG